MSERDREACREMDRRDPLARVRDAFVLPDGVIYLDGNSLGALPKSTPNRLKATTETEWGNGLIRSWNDAKWIDLPAQIGAKLAALIGAQADEVIVADSTSVNLFKLLSVAMRLRPERRVLLAERDGFPTDLYIAQGTLELFGGDYEVRLVERDQLADALTDDVAVLLAAQVDFRSGALLELEPLTHAAHDVGALTVWDLSHSAGVAAIDLEAAEADFAVGSSYKFLNGGPGAPAFVYVAKRHQAAAEQPLRGWMGHARPFDFDGNYTPADGIRRFLCGTPPVLSMIALDEALNIWTDIDIGDVQQKRMALTDQFIALMDERCASYGFTLASPRDAAARGGHVSYRHVNGYPITQALIARDVIGDFRAPDLLRFGFAPLYVRYVDVCDAVGTLAEIMQSGDWDRAEYRRRTTVT